MNGTGPHRRVSQMPSRAAGLQQGHCVSVAALAGGRGMCEPPPEKLAAILPRMQVKFARCN